MKKITLLVGILLIGLNSCNSSDDPTIIEAQGIVVDAGEPAADGCGWLVRIAGVDYSPTYLNTQYREDGLEVLITFEPLESTFICGLMADQIPQIRIEQIRPF